MSKKQDLAACLLGIVVAIILWFTILGRDIQADVVFLRPFHSFQALWRDVQYGRVTGNLFGNILIFIPVGFLISTVTNWEGWTVLVGAGFSLLIEGGQLLTSRGCFDLDDVFLNTLGVTIGYGLYHVIRKLEKGQAKD